MPQNIHSMIVAYCELKETTDITILLVERYFGVIK